MLALALPAEAAKRVALVIGNGAYTATTRLVPEEGHKRRGPSVMPGHHKRRATTSGGLGAPPYGSLFPPPRGVEDAGRCSGIAGAPPPAEETGKAIVWHTEL